MMKANTAIIWGSVVTLLLVAACVVAAFLTLNPAHGAHGGAIYLAMWFYAAYLISSLGLFVVAAGTISNLVERRSNPDLETADNVKRYWFGTAFSIIVFALLATPWLL